MLLNKQQVLNSLNKLTDKSTRAKGWEELTAVADRLDGTSLPAFLQCLHNTTAQYSVACRRGAVRMYGHLAMLHPEILLPYLPRVSECIVARLKEKDATRELREACAGAFGALVAELGGAAALPVVLKPLLPLLSDTNEAHQLSGALALSAILPAAGELAEASATRIAAPLVRTLGHPTVGAHAALLDAAATLLSTSAAAATPYAASLLACAYSGASSNDFGTRRASAEFVKLLSRSHVGVLTASAARAYSVLHLLRADKQKVVREAALSALKAVREAVGEPGSAVDGPDGGKAGTPGSAGGVGSGERKPSISQVRQLLRQQQQQQRQGGGAVAAAAPANKAPDGFDFSLRVPKGLSASAITGSTTYVISIITLVAAARASLLAPLPDAPPRPLHAAVAARHAGAIARLAWPCRVPA